MDFHNLCQRLDVDNLRAKLPALPQIKLPKSLPKLRGRKIFRSSRDNVNNNKAGTAMAGGGGGGGVGDTSHHHTSLSSSSLQLPQQQQQSQQFINRTPQRISTISSLMHEQQERMGPTSTYCSAGSLDDDYYAPDQHHNNRDVHRPISPIKMPSNQTESGTVERSSLTQRLQRGYKSLSELRLKHLFAKQTTVRRDQIEVDRYVQQYEAELRSEAKAQARRDREIADNYDIRIKTLATPQTSRQNTLDEGNEADVATPPPTIKQRRSVAEHSGDESGMEEEATPPAARRKPIGSGIAATRFAKVRQPPLQMPVNEEATATTPPEPPRPPSGGAYKQLLQRLPASLTSLPTLSRGKEKRESTPENAAEPSKLSTLRFPMKSKTSVEDSPPQPPADGASSKGLGLRHNIKRLRKSIKRPLKATARTTTATTSQESGDEDQTNARPNSSVTLRTRLSRSTDQLQQRWRKSFKFSTESDPSEANADGAGGAAAGAAYLERTFNKLNEKMHQLKFFQRQSSNVGVASPPSRKGPKPNTVGHEPIEIDDEELAATYHHSDSDDDDSGQDVCAEEAFGQVDEDAAAGGNKPIPANTSTNPRREMAKLAELQAKRSSTAWSSESLEEIPDEDYPRVLIHQEHTDAFESTLIIAVATAPPPIPPPPVATNWLPNEKIIASFQEQVWPAPALYKPKSIDIFEASSVGGAAGAFADFDEVLRNAPVLRISADVEEEDEEEEEEEDEEEDDSSSRVTRIRVRSSSPQIGNSRESLMEAQQEEDEEEEDKEEMAARDKSSPETERPPSTSPPPPPLPQRRPNQVPVPVPVPPVPIYDAVPPPLPTSRPPLPLPLPIVSQAIVPPQRSASMSRPSKPLVKTSSLRLTYNEQVRPGDVGKVNKLISRFEGGRPRLCPRRLHSEEYESNYNNNNDVNDNDAAAAEEETRVEIEAMAKTIETDVTRTPTNRTPIPEIVTSQPVNENLPEAKGKVTKTTTSTEIQLNLDRQNSNCSRSEYGSPLAYPSSRRCSTPTVSKLPPPPLTSSSSLTSGAGGLVAAPAGHSQAHLRQINRRSRRSMTRDDDNFYSFDSDEENSYYSISPSGSSRYVVEI
ncbi:uncharacterized protein Dwil_GK25074 [Drosophila willistoni]|uniref:Uncharacterized protein n=1 Tax=Drosophila willistoni TaxID=7260 RepID=B4NCI7_DROWI|nr:protein PIP82 isoform X1 [Drosophila willistoni]EDW82546.1 uncharacterized protein Dwil_GK25074 [Drosophila willistoni]